MKATFEAVKALSLTLFLFGFAKADIADNKGWGHYGGSERGLQYSALSQITTKNVGKLQEVWRFRTGELGQGLREPFAFEANPILAEGRLYFPTGSAIVFALNPATGAEIWRYDPKLDRSRRSFRSCQSWRHVVGRSAGRCKLCLSTPHICRYAGCAVDRARRCHGQTLQGTLPRMVSFV